MMKNIYYTTIFSLLLLLQSCDYYDNRLVLHNNTNRTLAMEVYEDTIPDFPSINLTEVYLTDTIVAGSAYNPSMPEKNGWEKIIYRSKNKKLNVIIYELDSLRKYKSIDTLIKHRIYRRYTYSKNELMKGNWVLKIDFR